MEGLDLQKEAVKQSFEVVQKFINKIIPFEQIGGLINDQIGYLRLKNLVAIIKKTEKILKEKNIQPKDIKLKTLLPLLNYSSLEEDENLRDKWAALLKNALDPDRSKYIKPIYSEILKDLTPLEVELLDFLYNEITKHPIEEQLKTTIYTSKKEIMKKYNLTDEECDICLDNLIRLNLFVVPFSMGIVLDGSNYRVNSTITLTKLGLSFIRSCKI